MDRRRFLARSAAGLTAAMGYGADDSGKLATIALCSLFLVGPVLAQNSGIWIGTWATSPTGQRPPTVSRSFSLPAATPLNGTVRYRLRISQGGTALRLRFTNEYGDQPLMLKAATVGMAADGLSAAASTLKSVTFGGKTSVVIPAGAPALSDAISMQVPALSDLVVSAYVDGLPVTLCPENTPIALQAAVQNADATRDEQLTGAKCTFFTRPFVSEISVRSTAQHNVLVTFGDSITDGDTGRSVVTVGGDRGWPGVLARRLQEAGTAVVNAGIGGNRLLQSVSYAGASAQSRFDRDVLSVPGVTHVMVLEGINDIGSSGPGGMFGDTPLVTPDDLIAAYVQIIARAREHGIKVIGATLLPFEGARYYSTEKEAVRNAVNQWIRKSKLFDGMVDFDAVMRDPKSPGRMLAAYDSQDHLHPDSEGYRRMAEVIDLALFK